MIQHSGTEQQYQGTVKVYGCVKSIVVWGTLASKFTLQWKDAQEDIAGEWGPYGAEKLFWEYSIKISSTYINKNSTVTTVTSNSCTLKENEGSDTKEK